jgi:DNA-directed RNA polymerase subunit RPC12/RpoP
MKRKVKYEEVKEFVESLGFIMVSESYTCVINKFIIKDYDGYYYTPTYTNFFRLKMADNFNKTNPYTIHNINLWLKLNNKPFELIDGQIYKGSHTKFKWKCLNCSDIFISAWNDIQTGHGCGVCKGRQVGLSNCLATKNPELAAEWHPTKNGNLTSYDVTYGSHKKVWWICEKGHEWMATINNRFKGHKCPYCIGKYPSKDYNLLVCNPELCKEWNYNKNDKTPEEYSPISGQKVWWKCKECGHEWRADIDNRNKDNSTECPECSRKRKESKLQEKVSLYLSTLNYIILHEHNCSIIPINPKTKMNLPYDNEIKELKLIIEVHGIQHYYASGLCIKQAKNKNTSIEYELHMQQVRDRYKRIYAKSKGYHYLEIPYWKDNKKETWKQLINNKINSILHT